MNYWLDVPRIIQRFEDYTLIAIPLRMRDEFRDWLESIGQNSWDEWNDDMPNFILFGVATKIEARS